MITTDKNTKIAKGTKDVRACDYRSLPSETEEIMFRIIGAAIAVHSQLGPGYFESAYHGAMCLLISYLERQLFARAC